MLSGDIGTPLVSTDNSYSVVSADASASASATLDGFTVLDGFADGSSMVDGPQSNGAGLYVDSGAPTLRNLLVFGNEANRSGGGLYVVDPFETMLVEDCVFLRNTANVFTSGAFEPFGGGGIHFAWNTGDLPRLELVGCRLQQNEGPQKFRGARRHR